MHSGQSKTKPTYVPPLPPLPPLSSVSPVYLQLVQSRMGTEKHIALPQHLNYMEQEYCAVKHTQPSFMSCLNWECCGVGVPSPPPPPPLQQHWKRYSMYTSIVAGSNSCTGPGAGQPVNVQQNCMAAQTTCLMQTHPLRQVGQQQSKKYCSRSSLCRSDLAIRAK